MTPKEYTQRVISRASPQYYNELVALRDFRAACLAIIGAAERLDQYKRALFYGKRLYDEPPQGTMPPLFAQWSRHMLHGSIGIATEAAELLAWLLDWLESPTIDGGPNLLEELGDISWYLALTQHGAGLTHEQVWQANDRKLATRYGEAFSEASALTRNIDAEDAALRGGTDGT